MADLLLEERYKQLETNFKAIVTELKNRPSSALQSMELEALLSKMDAECRHALLRAQASNMPAHQRLEERTAILQRNFTRVVELMGEPSSSPSAKQSPAAPSRGYGSDAEAPGSAQRPPTTSHVVSPAIPHAAAATVSSPLFSELQHPWSGAAYAAPSPPAASPAGSSVGPPGSASLARDRASPAASHATAAHAPMRRYDSYPSNVTGSRPAPVEAWATDGPPGSNEAAPRSPGSRVDRLLTANSATAAGSEGGDTRAGGAVAAEVVALRARLEASEAALEEQSRLRTDAESASQVRGARAQPVVYATPMPWRPRRPARRPRLFPAPLPRAPACPAPRPPPPPPLPLSQPRRPAP